MFRVNCKSKSATIFIIGVLLSTLIFSLSTQNAYSGEAVGSDKIKEMLLRPGGWLVKYRGTRKGVFDFFLKLAETIS